MPTPIIAIDGPSGAGKGTVARAVAEALGYRHVDTGAMYRAVAWKAVHDALDLADEPALATLAREAAILVEGGVVAIDDQEVTRDIRTPEIDAAASSVARLPGVRAALVARQRALAVEGGLVMEGRDIGTVVFPQADVKIYLDASEAERVRRRTHDPAHTSGRGDAAAVAASLQVRDRSDTTRHVSPLLKAGDAHYVDTTEMSVDDVVAHVLALVRQALPSPA
jgi:cytidylate kinase